MAYIPSEKVSFGLARARTGLWLEPLMDGRIALVCKIPETVIKTLYRGAKTSILLGVMQAETLRILCLGLRVQDEPDNPFSLTMPNTSPEDAALLKQVLQSASTTLHCLNELNHPVLSACCDLEPESARLAADRLNASDHWLLTPLSSTLIKVSDVSRILELALDRFQHRIYRPSDAPGGDSTEVTTQIPLALDIWPLAEIFDVSPTLDEGFRIDDRAEGPKLERLIHVVIDSVYPGSSYRSPGVKRGKVIRELADVVGFDADSICLIQAKALPVLTADLERSSDRRTATVTKHITKALKQLVGALKQIRSGNPLFDADGKLIALPNPETSIVQAIVVLSEMYAFADWKAIASEIVEASENEVHSALFHVLDIQELAYIANMCKSAEMFDYLMLQRWVGVMTTGTVYGRARLRHDDPTSEEE